MIEVADVSRRFAADYLSAHGASMLPSTSARHRGHPSTAAPRHLAARFGAASNAIPRCSPGTPVPTAVARSATPHKPRKGGSNAAGRRCCRCRELPRHHHRARRVARGAACSSARRLCRADAGQCRGDHRTRPRSPLCRRHRGRARRAAHVDSAVEPAPTRSLPGQRRRYNPRTPPPGIRHAGSFWVPIKALDKLVRGKFRDLLRRKCPDLVIPEARCGVSAGSSTSPPGATAEQRRARCTSPATSFVSLSPMPASSASTTKQSPSNARNARPAGSRTCRLSGDEFMRRFLQHVLPRGFHKVRYFGLWHPRQRHNAARVPRMLQLQAPPKLDQPLDFAVLPLATADAEATPSIEPLVCPHCQGQLIFIRTLSPRQAMAP